MYKWQIMHLCEKQLRDINPNDILNGGLYRRCDIYKGGGGYDKFEEIYRRRTGATGNYNEQFVVQLKGCPLNCPYCYVTDEGVRNGKCSQVDTVQLVNDFKESGFPVFHLMGGAPALYIDHWKELIIMLGPDVVFHSDLLLVEQAYNKETISALSKYHNCLYAVSIKGKDEREFHKNTGKYFNYSMFWRNFDLLYSCDFPFYLTFTGMPEESVAEFKETIEKRYGKAVLEDSFSIDLVEYEALK